MVLNETYKLNNGVEIPKLGLGTWLIEGEEATQAVKDAIAVGYKHIDTAEAYGNEVEVGKGIRESGMDRKEIFLTTKLAAEAKDYETAKKEINQSLEKLDCEYIDLMIIHSPQPWVEVNQSDNRYFHGNLEAYKALEEFYKEGKIKAIGVSNFGIDDLKNIIEHAEIKPCVNQILCHISNTPIELLDYCKENDILVEAYSPIGHGEILKHEKIIEMAQKYQVTVSELCIRYTLQLGAVSLPKTANKEHMIDNTKVDFEISNIDMEELKNMEHIKDYGNASFFPVYGGKM
jgi:diketogulonate reductase-like aldo/keto reductase